MGRRRKSVIEDLLTLVARAPWPVGVGLAVVSFMVLNQGARGVPIQSSSTADISRVLFSNLGITLAGIGQYLLPGIFLVAALGSFLRSRKNARIYAVAAAEPVRGVADLSWREFESLIGELFRKRGFSVKENYRAGPDGGVDVELRRNGELFLVQCKHWRARKIPVSTSRDLYGAMTARQAAAGFVVTSGDFTSESVKFAAGRNIELIGGKVLAASLRETRPAKKIEPVLGDIEANPGLRSIPACPSCGNTMVERVAKRGPQPGGRFWGCSDFPACRGTRKISD
ncbi:MAG: restriction endonuclease [Xanthomonadales bacterium]|nr:restriction endonuclease [Xanthomonadales bacterium]